MTSKATRTLIRTHHTLEKRKAVALSQGDASTAAEIDAKIDAQGGLKRYQQASLLGQEKSRGGDSSKLLMEWLEDIKPDLQARRQLSPIRLLEVGALSTTNAVSTSRLFDIERIDLNSQADGIKQQDFMERPLPLRDYDYFDIISLSLVLNYVPSPQGKGNMLKRTLKFLRQTSASDCDEIADMLPCLFLVLPFPCVANSRYMTEQRLEEIMMSMGYATLRKRSTNKLIYYLFKATNLSITAGQQTFKKVELRSGGNRNNFAIVLE